MVQSFTDGLPSRLGFDQGKKQRGAGGQDYYLEMCLWKHLCVQAHVLRVRFSVRVPALLWPMLNPGVGTPPGHPPGQLHPAGLMLVGTACTVALLQVQEGSRGAK